MPMIAADQVQALDKAFDIAHHRMMANLQAQEKRMRESQAEALGDNAPKDRGGELMIEITFTLAGAMYRQELRKLLTGEDE